MRWSWLLVLVACGKPADKGPDLAVVGEATRVRLEDAFPAQTPWFDGTTVTLVAARGETLGIQVLHRSTGAALTIPGVRISAFDVQSYRVSRPSTALFGGSRGKGRYADGLTATTRPTTSPAYFELVVDGEPGERTGELVVGERRVPVK